MERGVRKLLRSGRGTGPSNPGLGLCQMLHLCPEVLLNRAEPLKEGRVVGVRMGAPVAISSDRGEERSSESPHEMWPVGKLYVHNGTQMTTRCLKPLPHSWWAPPFKVNRPAPTRSPCRVPLLKLPAELARKPHPLHSHKLVSPQKGISPTSQFHQDYLAEVKFAFKGQKNCQHWKDFVQLDKHTSIPLEWKAWLRLWKMKRWVWRACEASSDVTY